jgi:hypothetical protein
MLVQKVTLTIRSILRVFGWILIVLALILLLGLRSTVLDLVGGVSLPVSDGELPRVYQADVGLDLLIVRAPDPLESRCNCCGLGKGYYALGAVICVRDEEWQCVHGSTCGGWLRLGRSCPQQGIARRVLVSGKTCGQGNGFVP